MSKSVEAGVKELRNKVGAETTLDRPAALMQEIIQKVDGGDNQFAELVQRTITIASGSDVKSIGDYALYGCDTLTSVNFPNAKSIGSGAFNTCTALTSADFSNAESIGNDAFNWCTALTSVNFPSATIINSGAFNGCTALTSAEFLSVLTIKAGAFLDCTNLSSLILRKRASLSSTSAIPSQTIVYVEDADLEWYSTASGWSTIYAGGRIKPISELPSA